MWGEKKLLRYASQMDRVARAAPVKMMRIFGLLPRNRSEPSDAGRLGTRAEEIAAASAAATSSRADPEHIIAQQSNEWEM